MSLQKIHDIETTIIVGASGTGTFTFPGSGVISYIAVQPPLNSTYDVEVIKYTGYGIYGNSLLTGNNTMIVNRNFAGQNTLYIENATAGSYKCLISILSGI